MSAGLPQHLTLDYLRSLLSRGVEHAPVTEEARKVLRQWVIEARRLARRDISAPPAPVSGMEHPHPEGVPESSEPASVDEISFGNELRAILNGVHSGGTEEEPAVPRHVAFDLEGETEEEK
ncbi:MAG: hypothetical protein ACLSUW_08595, partial [Akkermansia sp.]